MSCGMATGSQAYYLLGTTRKALVVAGPVSSEMARREAAADRGQALISDELASALPRGWVQRRQGDGSWRLRFNGIRDIGPTACSQRRQPAGLDSTALLPVEFRSLVDIGRRHGELKQVAMAFIRLDGTDALLAERGPRAVHARLKTISALVDETAAVWNVCWLETQAEADSVRWTLIAGAPTATERDGERLLRALREITDRSPVPLRIGANLGVVFVGDMGHPRAVHLHRDGRHDEPRRPPDDQGRAGRDPRRGAAVHLVRGDVRDHGTGTVHRQGQEAARGRSRRRPLATTGDSTEREDPDGRGVIVGRAAELDDLLSALEAGGTVELVGEAGIGKSRLWHEARAVTASSRPWAVVRAEPHETTTPYAPFGALPAAGGRDRRSDQRQSTPPAR